MPSTEHSHVDSLMREVRSHTTQTASLPQETPFRPSTRGDGEGSEHTEKSLQLRVGQVPAEEPNCGETSVEQKFVWVECEGGAGLSFEKQTIDVNFLKFAIR